MLNKTRVKQQRYATYISLFRSVTGVTHRYSRAYRPTALQVQIVVLGVRAVRAVSASGAAHNTQHRYDLDQHAGVRGI